MAYSLKMARFLMLSLAVHFMLATLSAVFVGLPSPSPSPVRVSIIEREKPSNEEFPTGKIIETPAPAKEEKPEKADILSSADSRAHLPEDRMKLQDSRLLLPEKKRAEEVRKAEYSEKKIPATTPEPEKKEKQDIREREDALASAEISKFMEKPLPGQEKKEKTASIEHKKTYDRTYPKPAPFTTRPDEPETENETTENRVTLEGEEANLFVIKNPDESLETRDEALVSLNTKKFEYMGYFTAIRKAVESEWYYPDEAIISGLSGRCVLRFTISGAGVLEEVRTVSSSGEKVLDLASQKAVKNAAPFPPFPSTIAKKRIHIVAVFSYQPVFNATP